MVKVKVRIMAAIPSLVSVVSVRFLCLNNPYMTGIQRDSLKTGNS